MNETIGEHIYEYDNFSFKIFVPDYWTKIYKGQPRKKLYHDYCVMLDLVKKVDKEKWIMDVGANHGIFSCPAAMLGYKVLGFEPVRSNYLNLEQARVENNLTHFNMFNLALSNENAEKKIYVPECLDNASFSKLAAVANMKKKVYTEENVQAVRFDDWITVFPQYADIGFIKLDVQGYEVEVLGGMRNFLINAHDIYLIVEFESHLLKMGHTFEELEGLINSYGFVEQPKQFADKIYFKV